MKKAMIIGLLLFGMIAQANYKVYELKKKAIYYQIKAQLEAEEITLDEPQVLWQKKVKHLKKEEAK